MEGTEMSDQEWSHRLNMREIEVTDEVGHFSLKHDLVEHVWENWGSRCVAKSFTGLS